MGPGCSHEKRVLRPLGKASVNRSVKLESEAWSTERLDNNGPFTPACQRSEAYLFGQRNARRLGVRSQQEGFFFLRVELFFDQVRPKTPGRPHFGNLHVKVHANSPEKREPRCKVVDVESCLDASSAVLNAIADGKRKLKLRISSRCNCNLRVGKRWTEVSAFRQQVVPWVPWVNNNLGLGHQSTRHPVKTSCPRHPPLPHKCLHV